MPRNLDHRIEMVVPVEAPHVRAEIETIFRRSSHDNSQAWELQPRRHLAARDAEEERAAPARAARRSMRGRDRARRLRATAS